MRLPWTCCGSWPAGSIRPPPCWSSPTGTTARLSPPARQVLDAAAVMGSPVETWLLVAAAGATPAQVDECVAAGMLQGQAGGVGFRHELARLAVERALGPGRRADLHGRALAALLTQPGAAPDPARLAHHADGAGDGLAVLAHAPVAARRAAALGAHREAAAQYERALRFAEGLAPAALAELLEGHSYECYLTDQLADAVASRERALGCWRALADRRREGDTLRWLSRLAWFEGRNADADRAAREAVELLEDLAPGPELAMAYSNLSQLAMLASNTDEALAWGSRAIELAESLGQTETLVHALNNVGTAELCARWPAGRPTLERSLALARDHGLEEHVARAYTNLAWTALDQRQYLVAARYREEGIGYCAERDLDTLRLYMLVAQARATSSRDAGPRPPAPSRWCSATHGPRRSAGSRRWPSSAGSALAEATRRCGRRWTRRWPWAPGPESCNGSVRWRSPAPRRPGSKAIRPRPGRW
jgi:tetratricopeptide (TPR) repeat protein